MRALFALLLVTIISGCATVQTTKVESGESTVGERLVVKLDGPWNHVSAPSMGPAQVWTMEGLPVDQLLIYPGIKDGEVIHAQPSNSQLKSFSFRANMQPDEIVAMFEGMLTRDGSSFKLAKLEPYPFAGTKGLRFEYALVRKRDSLQLSGVGFAGVSNGELFAMMYTAPRLGFFSRHQPSVEQMARATRLNAKPAGAN